MAVVLNPVIAHSGRPLQPHDLWGAWNADPTLVLGLILVTLAYAAGRRRGPRRDVWRARAFAAGVVTLVVALVSPLDALSDTLASAHMVQHVLLITVAAPLFALAAPGSALLRGAPAAARRGFGTLRRRLGLTHGRLAVLRQPVVAWFASVVTLWFWHAAAAYDAALRNEVVHVVEHASFLAAALLLWRVILGARGAGRVPAGGAVLLVFGATMSNVLLSVLLTFARQPWYAYPDVSASWGLDPLADQQLAGAIMWVPTGLVYVATALVLMITWVRASEHDGMGVHATGEVGPVAVR